MVQVGAPERGAEGAARGRGAKGVNVYGSRYVVSGADGAGLIRCAYGNVRCGASSSTYRALGGLRLVERSGLTDGRLVSRGAGRSRTEQDGAGRSSSVAANGRLYHEPFIGVNPRSQAATIPHARQTSSTRTRGNTPELTVDRDVGSRVVVRPSFCDRLRAVGDVIRPGRQDGSRRVRDSARATGAAYRGAHERVTGRWSSCRSQWACRRVRGRQLMPDAPMARCLLLDIYRPPL